MTKSIKYSILNLATLLAMLFVVGCESDQDDDGGIATPDYLLSTFVVTYNGSQLSAAINQDSGSFTISSVVYSDLISDVTYTLTAGATISPIPGAEPWASSQTYTVSTASESKLYTLNLPNLSDELWGDGEDPEEDPEEEPEEKSYKVVGYLPAANSAYTSRIDQIDWSNLSHVIMSFLQVNADGSVQNSTSTLITRMEAIQEVAAENDFKVMIAVQSSSTASSNFYTAISSSSTRSTLVENLVDFVEQYDLDGIDIDFEEYDYVGKSAYSNFIIELGTALDDLEQQRGREVLYSVAVAPNYNTYPTNLGSYVDFINLMIYDLQPYSAVNTDHASVAKFKELMDAGCTKFGATKDQLIGGVPFYGYTYDNLGKSDTAAASSATQKSYSDIFSAYLSQYGADYIVGAGQVGNTIYDGQVKIAEKSQYVVDNDYGGVMIWQIVQDLADTYEEYKLLPVIGKTLNDIEGK